MKKTEEKGQEETLNVVEVLLLFLWILLSLIFWKAIKMKVMVICYNYVINQTQTQESFKFC